MRDSRLRRYELEKFVCVVPGVIRNLLINRIIDARNRSILSATSHLNQRGWKVYCVVVRRENISLQEMEHILYIAALLYAIWEFTARI